MRYRFLLLVILLSTAISFPARAWTGCGAFGANTSGVQLSLIHPGIVVCHDTTATAASEVLDVAKCNHVEFDLDPDMQSTGGGCEGYLWRCRSSAFSTSTCDHMIVDTDGDGVPDDVTLDGLSSGRKGQQYQTGSWVYWQPTVNTGSKQCRMLLACH